MKRTLPERIFISGFMGAGKSTIGEALSQKMKQPFYDLDTYIEERAGQPITTIFKAEGEKGFREKEKEALLVIIRNKKGIIALGGGSLQSQHLVDHIKVKGMLVFIDTPLSEILNRIMEQTHRPFLMNENGEMKSPQVLKEELQLLYEQRLPFYKQAEVTINAAEFDSTDALAVALLQKIKHHAAIH